MTPTPTETRPMTRDRLSTVVLVILAGLGVLLCVVVATPFLPALTWAPCPSAGGPETLA
jgi:hypothetical protein